MAQTTVPAVEHWQHIHDILHGYRSAQVMITATQLRLFDRLAEAPQTATALAEQTGSEPYALLRLLNAAAATGLLQKEGETFANTPLADTCLVADGAYSLANLVRRGGAFYQRWSYLREAVTSGERPEPNIRDEDTENWVLDFELALFDLARPVGPAVADALDLPGNRPLKLLDVGGGHGGYSMALARRYPNLQPTIFELPAAAEVAGQIIEAEGMADRVTVQVGDFQKDELGSGYDLILLFGVLVSETREGKLRLLRKAYRALAPGGTIVVRSMWLDEDRAGPYKAALFSLQMLLSNNTGDLSTLSEIEAVLEKAGFVDVRLLPLSEWRGTTLCLATKAAVDDTG